MNEAFFWSVDFFGERGYYINICIYYCLLFIISRLIIKIKFDFS